MRHIEPVMGTVVSFDVRTEPIGDAAAAAALRTACATLHRADAVFSTWKPESPVSRLRRGEIGIADAPPEVAEVLAACAGARALSGGWFDPWAMPGGVDPTGLVKGWAAQRAIADLQAAGIRAAMVNAGGDVVTCGRPIADRPWQIAIRDPQAPERILGVLPTDGAVATSGTYERGYHVLDPRSGAPARRVCAATVTGTDLALADALATALLAEGEPGLARLARVEGYSACVVRRDGTLKRTPGFALTAAVAG
jgi:thiamine biosynthesis lipoprotein